MQRKHYVITSEDIGKSASYKVLVHQCLWCDHRDWDYPFAPLGIVQESDVGKMCVKVGEVWQVENEVQFKKRVSAKE